MAPCHRPRPAYCGHINRQLDPSQASSPTLSVFFEFYPHSGAGRSRGTLVATEGGPGYPATESRADYLALFGPLMREHDLLIMDNRGTGRSGAINCAALQRAASWTTELIAACGASLGERASLYSTEYAADDLAAIIGQLGLGKINLYGDSYGTYFEQVFATRHPDALRSLVLDGAYPLVGPDYAWYPNYAEAMRDKFDLACARFPPCAALTGSSIEHVRPALEMLRAEPFAAVGFDADGNQRHFQADAAKLAIVMFGNAPAATTTRELDAAARAFAVHDRAPLLRLMAETSAAVDSRDPSATPTLWSAGLAAAVMCQDPPQVFDMALPLAQRAVERDRVMAERRRSHPDGYAPFTLDEYRAMPLDYSFLDQCVDWPVPPTSHPAGQVGKHAAYPDVPALVLSGELDDITTLADGAAVAAAFKQGVQVRIANSFHVNALPRARSTCGAELVRRFITDPSKIYAASGTVECASQVPALRLVPRFATLWEELLPAGSGSGNRASDDSLKMVNAALSTIADVLAHAAVNSSGRGRGLRGGSFLVHRSGTGMHVQLSRVRWVNDLAVSGTLHVTPEPALLTRATRTSALKTRAVLRIYVDGHAAGRLATTWTGADEWPAPMARIRGRLDNLRVEALTPVP